MIKDKTPSVPSSMALPIAVRLLTLKFASKIWPSSAGTYGEAHIPSWPERPTAVRSVISNINSVIDIGKQVVLGVNKIDLHAGRCNSDRVEKIYVRASC